MLLQLSVFNGSLMSITPATVLGLKKATETNDEAVELDKLVSATASLLLQPGTATYTIWRFCNKNKKRGEGSGIIMP